MTSIRNKRGVITKDPVDIRGIKGTIRNNFMPTKPTTWIKWTD